MKVDILGVHFDNITMAQAVDHAAALAGGPGFHYVVTPNPELVVMAQKQTNFRDILNGADLTLADGIGVIYAGKILGSPLVEKVPGVDFASQLMAQLAQDGRRLFLLGAKPGVADKAAVLLAEHYPGLVICGTHDGYFQRDEPVVTEIKATRAEVLFVCLGAPRQELWMDHYGAAAGVHLAVGLGGSLDVFSGTVDRAPAAWQKSGTEWLYRLIKQPSRLGRVLRLPLFLLHAVTTRLSGR